MSHAQDNEACNMNDDISPAVKAIMADFTLVGEAEVRSAIERYTGYGVSLDQATAAAHEGFSKKASVKATPKGRKLGNKKETRIMTIETQSIEQRVIEPQTGGATDGIGLLAAPGSTLPEVQGETIVVDCSPEQAEQPARPRKPAKLSFGAIISKAQATDVANVDNEGTVRLGAIELPQPQASTIKGLLAHGLHITASVLKVAEMSGLLDDIKISEAGDVQLFDAQGVEIHGQTLEAVSQLRLRRQFDALPAELKGTCLVAEGRFGDAMATFPSGESIPVERFATPFLNAGAFYETMAVSSTINKGRANEHERFFAVPLYWSEIKRTPEQIHDGFAKKFSRAYYEQALSRCIANGFTPVVAEKKSADKMVEANAVRAVGANVVRAVRQCSIKATIDVVDGVATLGGTVLEAPHGKILANIVKVQPLTVADLKLLVASRIYERVRFQDGEPVVVNYRGKVVGLGSLVEQAKDAMRTTLKQSKSACATFVFHNERGLLVALMPDGRKIPVDGLLADIVEPCGYYEMYEQGGYAMPLPFTQAPKTVAEGKGMGLALPYLMQLYARSQAQATVLEIPAGLNAAEDVAVQALKEGRTIALGSIQA